MEHHPVTSHLARHGEQEDDNEERTHINSEEVPSIPCDVNNRLASNRSQTQRRLDVLEGRNRTLDKQSLREFCTVLEEVIDTLGSRKIRVPTAMDHVSRFNLSTELGLVCRRGAVVYLLGLCLLGLGRSRWEIAGSVSFGRTAKWVLRSCFLAVSSGALFAASAVFLQLPSSYYTRWIVLFLVSRETAGSSDPDGIVSNCQWLQDLVGTFHEANLLRGFSATPRNSDVCVERTGSPMTEETPVDLSISARLAVATTFLLEKSDKLELTEGLQEKPRDLVLSVSQLRSALVLRLQRILQFALHRERRLQDVAKGVGFRRWFHLVVLECKSRFFLLLAALDLWGRSCRWQEARHWVQLPMPREASSSSESPTVGQSRVLRLPKSAMVVNVRELLAQVIECEGGGSRSEAEVLEQIQKTEKLWRFNIGMRSVSRCDHGRTPRTSAPPTPQAYPDQDLGDPAPETHSFHPPVGERHVLSAQGTDIALFPEDDGTTPIRRALPTLPVCGSTFVRRVSAPRVTEVVEVAEQNLEASASAESLNSQISPVPQKHPSWRQVTAETDVFGDEVSSPVTPRRALLGRKPGTPVTNSSFPGRSASGRSRSNSGSMCLGGKE